MADWKTPQQPSFTPEGEMLDSVRRRLIEIHYGLADATNDEPEAKAWAQRELMTLIRELAPYRKARAETTDAG
jgi:hypothetical protein